MSELGNKHECLGCGTKFYDLGKSELVCPKCGENQKDLAAAQDSLTGKGKGRKKPTKKKAKAKKKAPAKKKAAAKAESTEEAATTEVAKTSDKESKDDDKEN